MGLASAVVHDSPVHGLSCWHARHHVARDATCTPDASNTHKVLLLPPRPVSDKFGAQIGGFSTQLQVISAQRRPPSRKRHCHAAEAVRARQAGTGLPVCLAWCYLTANYCKHSPICFCTLTLAVHQSPSCHTFVAAACEATASTALLHPHACLSRHPHSTATPTRLPENPTASLYAAASLHATTPLHACQQDPTALLHAPQ